jgi:hypothetical protein
VFTAASTFAGSVVSLRIKKFGNPTDDVNINFVNTSGNLPSTFLNSNDYTIPGSSIDTTGSDFSRTIPSTAFTAAGVYAIEISRTGANDAVNYYALESNISGGSTGDQACLYNGSSWSALGGVRLRYSINGGDLFDIWKRSDDTVPTSTDSITASSCLTISSLSSSKLKTFDTTYFDTTAISASDRVDFVWRNTATVPSTNVEISLKNS